MITSFFDSKVSMLDKLFVVALMLFAFFIPMADKKIPLLIAVWVLLWMIRGRIKFIFPLKWKNAALFVPAILYFLHLTGLLYTANLHVGLFDVQVKFSLLLFPLLFISDQEYLKKNRNLIFLSFIFGNFIAGIICFIRYIQHGKQYISYTEFSIYHHPSYAAMFVVVSIFILLVFLLNRIPDCTNPPLWQKLCALLLILFFLVFTYFLSSRTGIISMILIPGVITLYELVLAKKWKFLLLGFGLMIVIPFYVIQHYPRFAPLRNFMSAPKDSTSLSSHENVTVRYLIARESKELIKENVLIGVGTGDVKDSLMFRYKAKNYEFAQFYPNLNAHDQYMETFIGLGIPGFVFLILLVLYPLLIGFREQNILLISFSLLIMINLLFESMFNTQAGSVSIAFFYCLFFLQRKQP